MNFTLSAPHDNTNNSLQENVKGHLFFSTGHFVILKSYTTCNRTNHVSLFVLKHPLLCIKYLSIYQVKIQCKKACIIKKHFKMSAWNNRSEEHLSYGKLLMHSISSIKLSPLFGFYHKLLLRSLSIRLSFHSVCKIHMFCLLYDMNFLQENDP